MKKFLKYLALGIACPSIIIIGTYFITNKTFLLISWLISAVSLFDAYAPYLKRKKYFATHSLDDISLKIFDKEIELDQARKRKAEAENEIKDIDIVLSEVNSSLKKLESALLVLRDKREKAIEQLVQENELIEEELNESFQSEENVLKLVRELDHEGGR